MPDNCTRCQLSSDSKRVQGFFEIQFGEEDLGFFCDPCAIIQMAIVSLALAAEGRTADGIKGFQHFINHRDGRVFSSEEAIH